MAGVKFSAFTTGATTANTLIVGYDSVAGTNNQYTLAQLKTGLAINTLYDSNGTITVDRTVALDAGIDLLFDITTATPSVIGFGPNTSTINQIRITKNNGSGGEIRVPLLGSFIVNSFNTSLQQNYLSLYGSSYITGTPTGFVTVSGSTGATYSIDARLGVVGTHNDNTSYAFRVQNSDSTDIFNVSNDTTTTVEKNLVVKGQGYTELHDTANTTLTVDWNNSNIQELTSLTGSHTFTASNPKAGATYILTLAQTGTVTATWTGVKWPAATAPTLSGAGKTDVITLICYDATGAGLYYGSATLNFTT